MLFTREDPSDADRYCPCGWLAHDIPLNPRAHRPWHAAWSDGVRIPVTTWPGLIPPEAPGRMFLEVTTASRVPDQRIAHELGRHFQRENRFDFPAWHHPMPLSRRRFGTHEHDTAHVCVVTQGEERRAIGLAIVSLCTSMRALDLATGELHDVEQPSEPFPTIGAVWVASTYRRRGVGLGLVRDIARSRGLDVAALAHEPPFTPDGRALAMRFAVDGRVRVGKGRADG